MNCFKERIIREKTLTDCCLVAGLQNCATVPGSRPLHRLAGAWNHGRFSRFRLVDVGFLFLIRLEGPNYVGKCLIQFENLNL